MDNKSSDEPVEALDVRMKRYENICYDRILSSHPYIVRLDGVSFSKYTRGFKTPYDKHFSIAMVKTMNNLIERFNASTGYTHSDEITLIFSSRQDENQTKEHIYKGRITKICSIMASYCSVCFNNNINQQFFGNNYESYIDTLKNKVLKRQAHFDARVVTFPIDNPGEIINHQIWRLRDCYRNAVYAYGMHYYSHKQLHKKTSKDIIPMIKDKGCDWEKVPFYIQCGTYGKKELYNKQTMIDGKSIDVVRQRILNLSFKIYYSDNILNILFDKQWPSDNTILGKFVKFDYC